MTTYIKLSEKDINDLKASEIVINYNLIANLIGTKPVKKFRDRKTAIKRLLETQEYLPKQTQKKPSKYSGEKELVVEKVTVTKKGSAMDVIQNGVLAGYNTIDKAINHFQNNWTPPRSDQDNDYSFARGYIIGAIREGWIAIKKD